MLFFHGLPDRQSLLEKSFELVGIPIGSDVAIFMSCGVQVCGLSHIYFIFIFEYIFVKIEYINISINSKLIFYC